MMTMRRAENLVLLGPPGAGKGTQAAKLANYFQIPTISVGRLLREEVSAGTAAGHQVAADLARGALVSDPLVLQLVKNRLRMSDTARGFVLDGMPRTLGQARGLDRLLDQNGRKLTAILLLAIPDDLVFERLRERLVCPECGTALRLRFHPPDPRAMCPVHQTTPRIADRLVQCAGCSRQVERREDDRPEVVRARLQVYHRTIEPILNYYRARSLLRIIDATGSPREVFARILKALRVSEDQQYPAA